MRPGTKADADREQTRWIQTLATPLIAASVFMAAALNGAGLWLMGAAIVCGPVLGVLALFYLAITSDTNGGVPAVETDVVEPAASKAQTVALEEAA